MFTLDLNPSSSGEKKVTNAPGTSYVTDQSLGYLVLNEYSSLTYSLEFSSSGSSVTSGVGVGVVPLSFMVVKHPDNTTRLNNYAKNTIYLFIVYTYFLI
jgi:hypothetical protein